MSELHKESVEWCARYLEAYAENISEREYPDAFAALLRARSDLFHVARGNEPTLVSAEEVG